VENPELITGVQNLMEVLVGVMPYVAGVMLVLAFFRLTVAFGSADASGIGQAVVGVIGGLMMLAMPNVVLGLLNAPAQPAPSLPKLDIKLSLMTVAAILCFLAGVVFFVLPKLKNPVVIEDQTNSDQAGEDNVFHKV
jgi:hypothetical protein